MVLPTMFDFQSQISDVRKAGDEFFTLPADVKRKYTRASDGSNFGWVSLERERWEGHIEELVYGNIISREIYL